MADLARAKAEREQGRTTPHADRITGAQLAQWAWAASRKVPGKLSEYERDALAQGVALVWMDRNRRNGRDALHPTRSDDTRKLLGRMAHDLATGTGPDSREVHDCASTYRTRASRERDTGPMIVRASEEGATDDHVTRAALDTSGATVIAECARELAADVAPAIVALVRELGPITPADERAITTAVLAAGMKAGESAPARVLAAIAVARGCSLITCKRERALGRRILAALDPADIATVTRHVARADVSRATWDRVLLTESERLKLRAVEGAQRIGHAVDHPSDRMTTTGARMRRFPAGWRTDPMPGRESVTGRASVVPNGLRVAPWRHCLPATRAGLQRTPRRLPVVVIEREPEQTYIAVDHVPMPTCRGAAIPAMARSRRQTGSPAMVLAYIARLEQGRDIGATHVRPSALVGPRVQAGHFLSDTPMRVRPV